MQRACMAATLDAKLLILSRVQNAWLTAACNSWSKVVRFIMCLLYPGVAQLFVTRLDYGLAAHSHGQQNAPGKILRNGVP